MHREAEPKLLEAVPTAELPGQPQLSDTRDEHGGWFWLWGAPGERGPKQDPCRAALLHTAWSSWGAGMSHLVGSHLQSLLLKQFHSLGGRKTGHQLRVSEEGALPPHPPAGPGQLGASQEEGEGKQSHYEARPGPALFCKLSLGSPGSLSAWQGEGRGLPAHLNGCIGIPEHLPAADAAVDAAHGHEQAEGEEVAVVVVSHTVV